MGNKETGHYEIADYDLELEEGPPNKFIRAVGRLEVAVYGHALRKEQSPKYHLAHSENQML